MRHNNWECPKCENKDFDVGQFAATGGGLSKFFNIQNKKFATMRKQLMKTASVFVRKNNVLKMNGFLKRVVHVCVRKDIVMEEKNLTIIVVAVSVRKNSAHTISFLMKNHANVNALRKGALLQHILTKISVTVSALNFNALLAI